METAPTALNSPVPSARPGLRVASVPSGHPYVRSIVLPPDAAEGDDLVVTVLADPVPLGVAGGQWWPPVMLTPEWITANASRFDVLHVHFGVESLPPGALRAALAALRAAGRPLIYTAHDLVNPQLVDQRSHLDDLDLLLEAAAEVITLTDGAAAEIESGWGRRATVIPHPRVRDLHSAAPLGASSAAVVIGTHLRDLRPNIDAVATTRLISDAVDLLRADGVDCVARIDVNEAVRDSAALAEVFRIAESNGAVFVRQRPRLDDRQLDESVADLDVAVLPYRYGTHSGWVELCFDLGVRVVGKEIGYIPQQHDEDFSFFTEEDARSLADAVTSSMAAETRPGSPGRAALIAEREVARQDQQHEVARAHAEVYQRVVSGGVR